jgi:ABC-type transport system substrate-binding protein
MKVLLATLLLLTLACSKESGKSKKTFYLNIGGEPSTLNPLASVDGYTSALHAYVFESLLTRDPDTYDWKPMLATEWKMSDDKRTFDFKLREGVKWHDGTDVTADDVKFSYDVIFSDDYKAVQNRSYYEAIKEVIVVDRYNVRFVVKDDYFQNFDICAGMEILPKHFYSKAENKKDFGKILIGTGPYKLGKYDKGQKVTLNKSDTWWGNAAASEKDSHTIPKLVLRFSKEENVSLELLKKGDIDYLGLRPDGFVKKTVGEIWDKKIVKVKTENKTPKGFNFVGLNIKHPFLKDRDVRKALALLMNRPMFLEKFEYGLTQLATGPVYVQSDYADPGILPTPYDPAQAAKLLAANGWKDSDKNGILDKIINGKKAQLSFTILEPMQEFMKYLTVFKEDAKAIGVDVNIKNVEWNSFIKLMEEKNFDAIRLAWSSQVDWDPKQIWHSSSANNGGSNFISYNNPEVDQLIDAGRKVYDRQKRIEIFRKVDRLIAEDYPYIWFSNNQYTLYGHTKRMEKPKDTYVYGVGQQYWKIQ